MELTAGDHAFVYGTLAQEIVRSFPADGKRALVDGIKRYGAQRGARMARTAALFGDEPTMQHYLAYGEWAPAPGEMDVEIAAVAPSTTWHVKKCPWHREWAERGMLDVGRLYCDYVDAALVRGFSDRLELGTGGTQTRGDDHCLFVWTGAAMTPERAEENRAIQKKVGSARLRSWAYHCAHLYKTIGECLQETLGTEARDSVYAAANEKLAGRYGGWIVELLVAGLVIDYWETPSLKKVERLASLLA